MKLIVVNKLYIPSNFPNISSQRNNWRFTVIDERRIPGVHNSSAARDTPFSRRRVVAAVNVDEHTSRCVERRFICDTKYSSSTIEFLIESLQALPWADRPNVTRKTTVISREISSLTQAIRWIQKEGRALSANAVGASAAPERLASLQYAHR